MHAPLVPDVLLSAERPSQASLPLAAPGVQRWIWEGRYGRMLIEVAGEDIYVNGRRVERVRPDERKRLRPIPDAHLAPT